MASSSPRDRAATRRSPRAAPRQQQTPAPPAGRPVLAPFAAVFAVLVAAEYLWLSWLLRAPGVPPVWYVVPVVLAAVTLAGAVLVVLGLARAWVLLAVVSIVLALGLLATAVLFGALGLGAVVWQALLLLVGPVGCLVLATRRPVREWARPARATRPPERGRWTHRTG